MLSNIPGKKYVHRLQVETFFYSRVVWGRNDSSDYVQWNMFHRLGKTLKEKNSSHVALGEICFMGSRMKHASEFVNEHDS